MLKTIQSLSQYRIVRWLQASGFSAVISIGTTVALHELVGLSERISFGCALVLSTIVSFIVVRRYVFQTTDNEVLRQFAKFICGSAGFRVAEYLSYSILIGVVNLEYSVLGFIVLVCSAVVKYFYHSFIVFGRRVRFGRTAV